tara:strand:+ start:2664 stop:3080 length:417 start_codon:yes stop_codon:yes gene_type:complete
MKLSSRTIVYLWIAYLAMMLCCVQLSYVHHSMHSTSSSPVEVSLTQDMNHHNIQMNDHGSHAPLSDDMGSEMAQTLFEGPSIIILVLGIVLVLMTLLPKPILQTVIIFTLRPSRSRRKRKPLLTFLIPIGMRAPPSIA